MADKYLDISGVSQLWTAIKGKTSDLSESINKSKASYINYDSSSKKINLYDTEGGTVLSSLDASPFIADGMLSDVTIIASSTDNPITYEDDNKTYTTGEKFIKFTWNTSAGNKVDYVKLDEIAKTYVGSTSIGINPDEGNMLYVKEVEDNKVKTDRIVLGGTPLAKYILANGGQSVIDAGNLQDVLIALLSEDVYPDATSEGFSNLVITMGNPSISVSPSSTPVEVGTKVTLSASCKTASASMSKTFSGFDYGYSTSLSGDIVPNANPSTIKVNGVVNANSNKLVFTVSGFNNATIAEATGNNTTPASVSDVQLTVGEGNNKVSVVATSPSFHAKTPTVDTYYIVSSLGNRSESEKVPGITGSESYNIVANAVTRSTETSNITGARKMFYTTSTSSIDHSTSSKIRAFTGSLKQTTLNLEIPQDTREVVLAMPSSWTITKIIDKGTNYDITSNLAKVDDTGVNVEGANGYAATKYYIYKYTSSAKMDKNTWAISIS